MDPSEIHDSDWLASSSDELEAMHEAIPEAMEEPLAAGRSVKSGKCRFPGCKESSQARGVLKGYSFCTFHGHRIKALVEEEHGAGFQLPRKPSNRVDFDWQPYIDRLLDGNNEEESSNDRMDVVLNEQEGGAEEDQQEGGG